MPGTTQTDDVVPLVRELQQGNRAALAELLTLAADGECSATVAAALVGSLQSRVPVIAFTGSAGVGKSSLLGAVVVDFAERGQRVGVLACDPESSVTGGALLGDRCRIASASNCERVFVRSLATSSGQQGIAKNIPLMLDIMKTFWFDRLFVETAGTGQGDVAVRDVADVVVLVVQPQTGDELQWEKAGILEVADIVVINKTDLPGADQTVADATRQLQWTRRGDFPIVKTSIARGTGVEELCRVLETVGGRAE